MISFMDDASSYGDYFASLSSVLSQYIDKDMSVCDAGCGIGQLSFALSPYVKKVTGIDRSESAIEFCNEKKRIADVPNISFECKDLLDMPEKAFFDVMVFNYFGRMEQIVRIARSHCRRKLIIIKKNYTEHRFSIGRNPIDGREIHGAEEYLEREKIAHGERLFSHEFGQPFRSIEDALEFFNIYSRDPDRSIINEQNVKSRLVETGNPVFPYYLPHVRNSRIHIIDMKEVLR